MPHRYPRLHRDRIEPRFGGGGGVEHTFRIDPGAVFAAARGLAEQNEEERGAPGGFRATDFRQSAARNAAVGDRIESGNPRCELQAIGPLPDFERQVKAGFDLGT